MRLLAFGFFVCFNNSLNFPDFFQHPALSSLKLVGNFIYLNCDLRPLFIILRKNQSKLIPVDILVCHERLPNYREKIIS